MDFKDWMFKIAYKLSNLSFLGSNYVIHIDYVNTIKYLWWLYAGILS